MAKLRAAFYKGTQAGMPGICDRLIRTWTRSTYSHVELVFDNGLAASASSPDGGVRYKRISFNPEKWDFVDLPDHLSQGATDWFDAHVGLAYDWLGIAHFALPLVGGSPDKWFCSEAVAAALGIPDPGRFDPGTLYAALAFLNQPANAGFFTPAAESLT